jgi:hypothetical protein
MISFPVLIKAFFFLMQIGVRGTDQTYNQRRTRFLSATKGSYKSGKKNL